MALQVDYLLNISSEPKTVYAKIEQTNTVVGKRPVLDDYGENTGEYEEFLLTNIKVQFYNSHADRLANKNPIEPKSFIFENVYVTNLESAYNLLKTHTDFTNAIDILEE